VSSPPYAITADLLTVILAAGSRLTAADLVLQRAAVRKYASAGAPKVARQARAHRMTIGLTVPRAAFRPPPRVDSAVLVVRRR
jgi:23S rRNA (adenine-N6)-dimethyltransferase